MDNDAENILLWAKSGFYRGSLSTQHFSHPSCCSRWSCMGFSVWPKGQKLDEDENVGFVEFIDSQSSLLEADNSRPCAKMHQILLLTGGAQFFLYSTNPFALSCSIMSHQWSMVVLQRRPPLLQGIVSHPSLQGWWMSGREATFTLFLHNCWCKSNLMRVMER